MHKQTGAIPQINHKTSKEKIRTISLFSGSGGLDLGLIQTGAYEIVLANDLNKDACATYRLNLGDHIFCGDIRSISAFPSAELVVGGPPCQGFSSANPNRAFDDPRNWLFKEYVRVLDSVKPVAFLMENVSGILTLENGLVFELIKNGFEESGYKISHCVLNAADFGVPQNRNRVILVGVREGVKARFNFPQPVINPPLFGKLQTVADAILKCSPTADDPNHSIGKLTELNAERLSHIPPGGSMINCPKHLQNGSDLKRAMRRLDPTKPSFTIVHNNCDHYYHPIEPRRITIREMALIQTYPEKYIFCGSKSEQSRQVGNSVPVKLAFHLGLALKDLFDDYRSQHNSRFPE
jgi:DNA (cytosine-5)-methyltransferase 1